MTFDGNAVDPLFIDPLGNFRLQPASPAVDGGLDTPPGALLMLDLNDNRRVQGAHVDIGAYEFIPDPLFQNGFE